MPSFLFRFRLISSLSLSLSLSLHTQGFTVKHYAGDVHYKANGFGDANRDSLRPDLVTSCISINVFTLA